MSDLKIFNGLACPDPNVDLAGAVKRSLNGES